MDQEIREEINKVLWYYEQYLNGDEDYLYAVREIAKGIRSNMKGRRFYYFEFYVLLSLLSFEVSLTVPKLLEDSDYIMLKQYAKDDLQFYLDTAKKLLAYVKQCLKSDTYEHLDDAYVLSINISYILENISCYFGYIRELIKTENHYYSSNYAVRASLKRDELNNDIMALLKKINIEGSDFDELCV